MERVKAPRSSACRKHTFVMTDTFILCPPTVMPYNSAHHCVVEVENFLLLLGGEDQWNPNGTHSLMPALHGFKHVGKERIQMISNRVFVKSE